ncbi:MAG: RsmD family RNA methyltransferase [Candidatus Marinimicrobia bacterium]|nr:RsmD family RNA methyltransferase [Candidatus Neomarinimicrobiota bacterium]
MEEALGDSIRPTKAIVRKSLFQRLEPWEGRRVCDLYAGIGTLGLEAVSRGSEHVTFVEESADAYQVLTRNVTRARITEHAELVRQPVERFLETCRSKFEVVLADPPYGAVQWHGLWTAVASILSPRGFFVLELPRTAQAPDDVDTRVFGKTKVCIWQGV